MANLVKVSNSHSFNGTTYNLQKIDQLNHYLDASFPNLDASSRVCPEGYRLPNVREMSLMWTTLSAMTTGDNVYLGTIADDSNQTPCRTHWSKGFDGTSTKVQNKWGWAMSAKHLLMAETRNTYNQKIRCVKDVQL